MKDLLSFFYRFFYPSTCPVCKGQSSTDYEPFCKGCWSSIVPYKGQRCGICGLPLINDAEICGECLKEKPFYKRVIYFGLYHGVLKESIHYFKYNGRRRLSEPLAELLLRMDIPEADMVVPVPMHYRSLRERGFNHSSLLAKRFSEMKGIPVDLNLLMKVKDTPPQVSLKREDRLKNLKGAFVVSKRLHSKNVILIDDVFTTGATVSECSRVLLRSGASTVTVVVLARSGIDILSSENVI